MSSGQVSSSDKDLLHDPGDAPPHIPHDRGGGDHVQLPVGEGRANIPEGATEQFVLNTHSDISSRVKGVELGHKQSDAPPDKTPAAEHEVREAVDVYDDDPPAGDGSQAQDKDEGEDPELRKSLKSGLAKLTQIDKFFLITGIIMTFLLLTIITMTRQR